MGALIHSANTRLSGDRGSEIQCLAEQQSHGLSAGLCTCAHFWGGWGGGENSCGVFDRLNPPRKSMTLGQKKNKFQAPKK